MSQTCTPPGKCRDFLEVRVSLVLREAVSSLARAPAAETKAGAPFLRMPSWPPSLAVALAAAGAVSGAAGCCLWPQMACPVFYSPGLYPQLLVSTLFQKQRSTSRAPLCCISLCSGWQQKFLVAAGKTIQVRALSF